MKKINSFLFIALMVGYLELVFGIIVKSISIYSIINGCLIGGSLYLLASILPNKTNKIFAGLIIFVFCFFFAAQHCVYTMFGFFIDKGVFTLAGQLGAFMGETIKLIMANIWYILVLFIPFFSYLFVSRNIEFIDGKTSILSTIAGIAVIAGLFMMPAINEETEVVLRDRGVLYTFINDTKERPEIEFIVEEIEEPVIEVEIDEKPVIVPHVYNIEFETSGDSTIQKLNDFFMNAQPTYTNEYTGIFEGKNLILILGESYNAIGIKEDLTPTLYKMQHEGFVFNNYYSPSYNSTVGGEFQLLNSAYAKSEVLQTWKDGVNSFPFSSANQFKNLGYSVRAYHDNTYTYMERNQYLKAYGFDNYTGCWNGFEKFMNCNIWPESDIDMVKGTIGDWINEDKFFTYYVTVSGHGPYTYDTNRSAMGVKHLDYVKSLGYNYSEKIMAYLSSMVELDRMMEEIVSALKDAGKLEDTVICLVGDHYPYYLEQAEYDEMFGAGFDMKFDSNRNSLILYNAGTNQVVSDKACGTMDVMPTLFNLFNIDYDSRIIPGKDILSSYPGMVFFGDGSWISDYGSYHASKGFKAKGGVVLSENYVENQKAIASTRMALTAQIFKSDYYKYIAEHITEN